MLQHPRAPKSSPTLLGRMDLHILKPGDEETRFSKADSFLKREGAQRFFVGARLSFQNTMHIGVFRQAVRLIPVYAEEAHVYQPWVAQSSEQIYKAGNERYGLSDERIARLREAQDPAIHIYDMLEAIRLTEYSQLPREPELLEHALGAYGVILASIHGVPKSS